MVAQTEPAPTTAPTDRSMPPPVMTNVMPMVTTPITDASRRIVSTLSVLANRSPAVMTPTMHSSDQRDHQAEVAPRRPAQEPRARLACHGGALAPGAARRLARVRRRRRSSCCAHCAQRSFHDRGRAPGARRCSAAGPSCTTRPAATTRTRSASPSTSSTSLDTTTTATPASASSRIST